MKLTQHTKYIWEYEGLITPEECDGFLSLFDETDVELITEFRNKDRDNNTYDVTPHKQLDQLAWSYMSRIHHTYIKDNQWMWYNWDKERLANLTWYGKNILRTYDKNDYYQWHQDHSFYNVPEVSYILYLNDGFEGGDTMFMNDKLKVTPKKGNVLCFPVDNYHIHKSSKIKSGEKIILWNCMFRRLTHKLQGGENIDSVQVKNSSKIW